MFTRHPNKLFSRLYQREARDEAILSQSKITHLCQDLLKKDDLIKALLDESADQATQLGLKLDVEKETLAEVTEQLRVSEQKRASAESALTALQRKFPGTLLCPDLLSIRHYATLTQTLFF